MIFTAISKAVWIGPDLQWVESCNSNKVNLSQSDLRCQKMCPFILFEGVDSVMVDGLIPAQRLSV